MSSARARAARWLGGGVPVALALTLALGCASHSKVTRLSPGVYQVECKDSLAVCLASVQDSCRDHGYDVLSASEKRDYVELHPEGYESVKSSATVRCRQAVPLFGRDPNLPVPVASASVSAAPAPSAVPPPAPAAAAAPAASASASVPPAVSVVPPPPVAPAPTADAGAP